MLFQLFSDIDECISNPCKNNGNCTDGLNGYICKCIAGFSGDNCETSKSEKFLLHGVKHDLEHVEITGVKKYRVPRITVLKPIGLCAKVLP